MLGLMYVGAAALYLMLVVLVARWAWRAVRRAGGSAGKAIAAVLLALIVMYLLAFWNLIPTAMTHRSACQRDAGFEAFVEPAAWIASHRDQLHRLKGIDPDKEIPGTRRHSDGVYRYAYMGGALAFERRRTVTKTWGLALVRQDMRIVDVDTQQALARSVDYGLGSREDARVWLTRSGCFSESKSPFSELTAFDQHLKEGLK